MVSVSFVFGEVEIECKRVKGGHWYWILESIRFEYDWKQSAILLAGFGDELPGSYGRFDQLNQAVAFSVGMARGYRRGREDALQFCQN